MVMLFNGWGGMDEYIYGGRVSGACRYYLY